MRICHMTSAHKSNDVRILEKECVSLAKHSEYEVFLVARGDSYDYKGVHIVGIGDAKGNRFQRIFGISRKIFNMALTIDADIYHFHDPELLLYAKKLKKRRKKVIFDSHEYNYAQILEKEYIPKLFRSVIANIYMMIENRACRYIDGAIFPCQIDGKHIFENRVSKCEFINNFPILEESSYEINESTINKRMNAVCCIGSLTQHRGIEQLIEACYILDVKLILGGDFSPEEFKRYLQQKEEYKVVDYRGYCSRDEVIDIYSKSLLGASTLLPVGQYPSIYTLPTKAYEYMMMKMPFIISDFAYSKYVVNKYKCGIAVDPSDPKKIAESIRYIIDNPKVAKEMGDNGRLAVEKHFNWANEEKKLYKFYNYVLED